MNVRSCFVALLTLPLVGCSQQIIGKWASADAPDAKAACQFQSMEFKNDKTFTATATVNGKVMPVAGKWTYDMMTLKLDSDSGKKREYDAVIWWGKTLEVKANDNGKTITQKYTKG